MVFSSTIFLFAFLPVTLAGYFLIRKDLRNVFLLVMSLIFYAVGEPSFVLVMMAAIAVNYLLGLLIYSTKSAALLVRRIVLMLSIGIDLSLLFYYKYFDFLLENINSVFGSQLPLREITLPIGISFFTFQAMSYLLDLYMDKVDVQKNPLHIALYIALFPQLIAGPIVRYSDINEQIQIRACSVDKFGEGVKRFTVGLGKKIILSNTFAILADRAFATPVEDLSVLMAWVGILSYTIQIYFDFGGYSDMAIGLGKMFGFDFLENFNYPYCSKSLTEFWRRWHISLSSWFRDYVYIPLGGNRKGNVYLHLLAVFFLTGLWHGASWNFIVWGMWHGLFLIIERVFRQRKITLPIPGAFKWIYTIFVVMVGWVLFRAPDLSGALGYLGSMFGVWGNVGTDTAAFAALGTNWLFLIISCLFSFPIIPYLNKLCSEYVVLNRIQKVWVPVFYIVLMVVSASYTVTSTYNPFIYFNF